MPRLLLFVLVSLIVSSSAAWSQEGPPPPAIIDIEDFDVPAMMEGKGTAKVRLRLEFDDNDDVPEGSSLGVEGFSLGIAHSPQSIIDLDEINLLETVTASLAETVIIDIGGNPNLEQEGGAIDVILDSMAPFDGQVIPEGEFIICNFVYSSEIDSEDTIHAELTFLDQTFGDPPVFNSVIIGGVPVTPILIDEPFTVAPFDVPFIRGDCNSDGLFDVADAIYIINFLFQSGPEAVCEEACNVNGTGSAMADVSDAIYIFDYQFFDGPPPPSPFPGCGSVVDADCNGFPACQ